MCNKITGVKLTIDLANGHRKETTTALRRSTEW